MSLWIQLNPKDIIQSYIPSSKNYLNMVWTYTNHDVWLAHYTEQTDYDKDYSIWQLTEKGKVPGIEENYTDINILYKKGRKGD